MKGISRLLILVLAAALVCALAQQVKPVPVKATPGVDGAAIYKDYCAVCHGMDGKGGGPAAAALTRKPTDLSTISIRNGGKYPELKVQRSIAGDDLVTAHGSKDMPLWGPLLKSMSGNQDMGQVRLYNLVKHIEKLQAK